MGKEKIPVSPAVRMLRQFKVEYSDHPYTYEEKGGTAVCARELGVDEHAVIKTLVMEDDRGNPMIVLMHGDLQVSTRNLARHLGVKIVRPCTPEVANRHTGYQVGGTSPFGARKTMPVYLEASILEMPRAYINGGRKGYLVGMDPKDIVRLLSAELVNVSQPAAD